MEALELEETITNYEQHDADGWCVFAFIFTDKSLCQTITLCTKLSVNVDTASRLIFGAF
jgi:hypothetical protein